MPETTQSIGEWIAATFPGADPASPRTSLRALEEMVELCLASGASAMDVGLAVRKALVLADRIHGQPSYIMRHPEPVKLSGEAADVAIVLHGLAHLRGFDLQAEIDKKMAVNRARKWQAFGDGTGQHIKEPTDGTEDADQPAPGELAGGQPDRPEAGPAGA